MALFTALISEEKSILIVCENEYDLLPIVQTLFDLMYPFEWCLPRIPFIVSDPLNPAYSLFAMVNNIQQIETITMLNPC